MLLLFLMEMGEVGNDGNQRTAQVGKVTKSKPQVGIFKTYLATGGQSVINPFKC